MQINPNVAKTPEGLKELALKKMKAYIKKDLKRLEQKTTPEKPITVMVWGDYAYTDKPAGAGLIVFGKWKGDFKNFAKKEVIASDLGAIGQAYFGGVDADGQKIIKVDLAKGKGKNKHEKLKKGLKKLIPQATFNVVFGEMEEDAIESLDKKMDAEVDLPEVITDDESSTDEGQIELEASTNVDGLLRSNLEEISKTVVAIKAAVTAKDYPTAQEDIPDLLDLCDEWFEIYRESLPAVQGAYSEAYAKVTKIKEDVAKLSEQLAAVSSQPNATGTNAGSTISATLQKGSKGDDVKTLQRLLIGLGYNLGSAKDDGDFGSKTHDAVVAVQKKYNLSQTGIVAPGSDTWKAITGKLPLPPQNVVTDTPSLDISQTTTAYSTKAMEVGSEMINAQAHPEYQSGYWGFNWEGPKDGGPYTKKKYKKGDQIDYRDQILMYYYNSSTASENFVKLANSQNLINPVTKQPYREKDPLTKDQIIQVYSQTAHKKPKPTWCNTFALDLSKTVLGEDSPFGKTFEEWKKANKKDQGCGDLLTFMTERTDIFEKVEARDGKDKFAVAWEAANKGYLVNFIDSGHIATAIKTDKLQTRKDSSGRTWTFGDVVQAGRTVGKIALNQAWKVDDFEGISIYIVKASAKGAKTTPNNALKPEEVKFQTKGTAQALKPNVDAILRDIFAKAGEANPVVISTYRSDEEQASIMYQNLEAYGEKNNRKGYKNKSAAGEVIDAYVAAKAANKSAAEVTGAILAAIKKVGAANISAHCNASNPAIDILPSSIKNKGNFESIIKADPRVMVICPPKDVSYHIEVK